MSNDTELKIEPKTVKEDNPKAFENLSDMVKKDMAIGDIVIADNLYVEHSKGVSLQDLATKYGKTVQEVKDILKSLGVIAKDEKKTV